MEGVIIDGNAAAIGVRRKTHNNSIAFVSKGYFQKLRNWLLRIAYPMSYRENHRKMNTPPLALGSVGLFASSLN
jgi:hypothetical protein